MKILGKKLFGRDVKDSQPRSNLLDYVLPQSIEFKRDKMIIGDAYARTYTVHGYPKEVSIKWLEVISRTQNAIVSYHVNKADVSELLENIQRTINLEKQKINETLNDLDKNLSKSIIEGLMALGDELSVDENPAINLSIAITIFDKNEEIFEKRCESFVSTMKGQKFVVRPLAMMQDEGFYNMMPLAQSQFHDLDGIDMTLGSWTGSLGYLASQSLNDVEGTFVGHDAAGEPIFWDIWARENGRMNSNLTIVGIPGSGKSTLAKHLMLSQLSRGDKVIAIDAEREYTGIARVIFGNVIEASGATNARVNPLQIRDIPEQWDDYATPEALAKYLETTGKNVKGPLSTHITWLKSWFKTYIPELDTSQISIIEDACYEMYHRHGITEASDPRFMPNTAFPIMEDLYKVLLEAQETGVLRGEKLKGDDPKNLAEVVRNVKTSITGSDRYLFNGHTTVDLSAPFNVFDVHSLIEASENQKNAQFFNITTFCWLAITKNKRERVILIVDEAHLFISTREAMVFEWLARSSRRFRKYEGSLWLMTQNVGDFYQASVREFGETLLNSPSNKVVLQQKATDMDRLRAWFALSDGEFTAVQNASRGSGLLLVGNIRAMAYIQPSSKTLKLIEAAGSGR